MKREELREKLREITTSKRVGFLYAVGNDDLLIDELENFIEQELSKAREEGYQNCMDDIWEEAKGLRSWTEHDGSISSADIEAGLQEAYLNIEDKLKTNK